MIDVRRHLTQRLSRERAKLELRRARRSIVICAIGVAAAYASWAFYLGNVRSGGADTVRGSMATMKFKVADVTGVVAQQHKVKFKGIPAGTITDVSPGDGVPLLTVKVAESFLPIYQNARATLRPTSPVQDLYLDITDRGTPAAGRVNSAHPLSVGRTDTSENVAEILQVFNGDTRQHMATLLDQLGHGLADGGANLRATFVQLTPLVKIAGDLSGQLRHRRGQTARLVKNFGDLTDELARRDKDLRKLVRRGGDTLGALASSHQDLSATMAALPGTLAALDTSLAVTRQALPHVDRAVADVSPIADKLPGALSDAQALARDLEPAASELQEPARRLRPLAASLPALAQNTSRATRRLHEQVGAVDHFTKSLAGCERSIFGFFQWTTSVFKVQDARGVKVRGDFAFGADSVSGVRDPNVFRARGCAPGLPKGNTP
jgi:ABC-type transporter Mla subunit MlaD